MKLIMTNRKFGRRGATVVEMAVMAPLAVMAMMGMIEAGYAFMVKQTVTLSARDGARAGVLPGATMSDIDDAVDASMEAANLEPLDPPPGYDPEDPDTWDDCCGYTTSSNMPTIQPTDEAIWVQVTIPLECVSVVGGIFPIGNYHITSKAYMRREGVDAN